MQLKPQQAPSQTALFQRQSIRHKFKRRRSCYVRSWLRQPQLPLSYIVKKGDTVWDIAVHYGISMKALQEANSLRKTTSRGDPLLFEGQVLVIPEKPSKVKQSSEFQRGYTKLKGKEQTKDFGRDLWPAFTSKVQATTVEEIDAQVHLDSGKTTKQDILLVVYTPWCEYCSQIEPLIESAAVAASKDPTLKVMKLRIDQIGTEYWAKEVLHVKSLPTIIALPQAQQHICIFTGERNSEGLLDFMNAAFGRKGKNRIQIAAPPTVHPQNYVSNVSNKSLLAVGVSTYLFFGVVLFGFLIRCQKSPFAFLRNIAQYFKNLVSQHRKNNDDLYSTPSQKGQTRVEIFSGSQPTQKTKITTIPIQKNDKEDEFGDEVDQKLRTYRSRVTQVKQQTSL